MKKYIAPSVKVVNIQNETILAGSTSTFGLSYEENGYGASSFGARSRGHFEEDEWE